MYLTNLIRAHRETSALIIKFRLAAFGIRQTKAKTCRFDAREDH